MCCLPEDVLLSEILDTPEWLLSVLEDSETKITAVVKCRHGAERKFRLYRGTPDYELFVQRMLMPDIPHAA